MSWINDVAILSQRPPPFLIEDVLPERAVAALVGEPGLGKTFIALDVAFSLATGTEWHGYATRRRPVAYIIAEGLGGMALRVAAWRRAKGIISNEEVLGVHFWRDAVQLASEVALREFAMALSQLPHPPGLIVVDTLARCFVGKDENHARDMGEFVRGCDTLRATGAAVLVVHHTGHLKERERGSTALRGAVDTLMIAQRVNGGMVLRCEKQREAEAFDPIGLKLRSVPLDAGEASAVVEDAELVVTAGFSRKWQEAVKVLDREPVNGMTFGEWMAAVNMPKSTFNRMIRAAIAADLIEHNGNTYRRKDTPSGAS